MTQRTEIKLGTAGSRQSQAEWRTWRGTEETFRKQMERSSC